MEILPVVYVILQPLFLRKYVKYVFFFIVVNALWKEIKFL